MTMSTDAPTIPRPHGGHAVPTVAVLEGAVREALAWAAAAGGDIPDEDVFAVAWWAATDAPIEQFVAAVRRRLAEEGGAPCEPTPNPS